MRNDCITFADIQQFPVFQFSLGTALQEVHFRFAVSQAEFAVTTREMIALDYIANWALTNVAQLKDLAQDK